MNNPAEPTNLETLLDRLKEAGQGTERVSIGAMLDAVGRRSFGAFLLVPGLIAFSPLSGIPGMPTTVAVMVLAVAGQLLAGRKHFWVPQWALRRSVSRKKFERALQSLRPVARFVDRFIRPRLTALTDGPSLYVVSVLAILVALTMPPMELVPFAATLAGAALTTFGLALIAHDGVLLLLAVVFYSTLLGTLVGRVF